jgi:hypothetical protein
LCPIVDWEGGAKDYLRSSEQLGGLDPSLHFSGGNKSFYRPNFLFWSFVVRVITLPGDDKFRKGGRIPQLQITILLYSIFSGESTCKDIECSFRANKDNYQ